MVEQYSRIALTREKYAADSVCLFETFIFLRRNLVMLFSFLTTCADSMRDWTVIPFQGIWWCHKSRGHVPSNFTGLGN